MDPLRYRIEIYYVLKEYTKFNAMKKNVQAPRFKMKYPLKTSRSLFPQTTKLQCMLFSFILRKHA